MFPESIPSDTGHVDELAWCPECQSPPSSDFAHVHYCSLHIQDTRGESDRLVDTTQYLFNGDAGGEDNRRVCEFLHRDRKEIRNQ